MTKSVSADLRTQAYAVSGRLLAAGYAKAAKVLARAAKAGTTEAVRLALRSTPRAYTDGLRDALEMEDPTMPDIKL